MKLSELLSEKVILTNFKAGTKLDAVGRLVDVIIASGDIPKHHRQAVLDALIARENICSTGMEHGVAIPHATVDVLERPAAAVAVSLEGVPFQSADGKNATIIVLLIITRKDVKHNVRTLAGIARLLNYEDTRQHLLVAKTPSAILDVIREEERKGVN
ncbi:MAG: hypothetical protein A2W23_08870 [Planctomycetes bacterium RBG_16_43_13]|nr:MAG: hypothetical protein A2W23_08870 [Planctomycetes bacterium RBG_16_43_13]